MSIQLPQFIEPDFSTDHFRNAPDVSWKVVEKNCVAPDQYHATSIFPEYYKLNGKWVLAEESRMDCCVVIGEEERLKVIELRHLKIGDRVIVGRTENGDDGIYLHEVPFMEDKKKGESFSFRSGRSRETAFSKDYDSLYQLLEYEKENGKIVWVMGPACAFDADARSAMSNLIQRGYVHGILAGNALATHDLEASYFGTALGQHIYTQISHPFGHYHHLDLINEVCKSGSIDQFIRDHQIDNGIIYSCWKKKVPYVLTGSIRDDGPLPGVIANNYEGQSAMREMIKDATTVICMATQLHTIAVGNMTPCFRVVNGTVRPLFIYSIDISEFALNKLSDRGSLTAKSIVANVQDFVVMVDKGLQRLTQA
ncbi:MAG: hypothetical protein GX933_09300 [Chloroflexi bacterium]|nr:hypothetical protein [Chloroflexota bacterium]